MQRKRLDVETCKARLEDIEGRLKAGKLDKAEADAARLALLSQLRSSSWDFGQDLRRATRSLIVPAVVFLLIAAIGTAASYMADPPEAAGPVDSNSASVSGSEEDGEMLASLTDYTRSIGVDDPASTPGDGKLMPDVNTMIERLAARLESAPEDVKGWQLLGWSYFQMERYEQAATAYAKALELDPSSAELKRSYEEAKSLQTGAVGKTGDGPGAENIANSRAPPRHEQEAQIRSMVDGLADRLESSPRDIEGWTRLMRSRVVLGEREVATTAFRKALEVFKDDFAASSKLTAAAIELGLKSE
jgi:cytochrome c-type biogenesis protein CcmH